MENASDILKAVNWAPVSTQPYQPTLDLFPESDDETLIRHTLTEHGEQNIDELHVRTRIPVQDLYVILLKLELEGRVAQLPGKCYALI